MNTAKREYSNGEVTVLWDASLCTHSGICVRGLPQVFNVHLHPWIDVTKATTEEIVAQVAQCPSGALAIRRDLEPAE